MDSILYSKKTSRIFMKPIQRLVATTLVRILVHSLLMERPQVVLEASNTRSSTQVR